MNWTLLAEVDPHIELPSWVDAIGEGIVWILNAMMWVYDHRVAWFMLIPALLVGHLALLFALERWRRRRPKRVELVVPPGANAHPES